MTKDKITKTESKKSKNASKETLEWIQAIIIAVILAFLIRTFIFQVVKVDKESMLPTLQSGDSLITYRLGYKFNNPEKGDIIIFKNPGNLKEVYIKRVIGIPGDTVLIEDGVVYVNNEILYEPYIKETTLSNFNSTVPQDHYFVMGDNRNASKDSRSEEVGFIPTENILGKATFRIWPVSEIGNIYTEDK